VAAAQALQHAVAAGLGADHNVVVAGQPADHCGELGRDGIGSDFGGKGSEVDAAFVKDATQGLQQGFNSRRIGRVSVG